MTVIKRYPNRKLYNTEAKQYITLDGIADLIRQGEDVQVVDNATGEDLTAVTLTQIIFEQEKKAGGFLPNSLLASLIQSSGQRLSALQRTLSSPRNLLHTVDEEIKRRVQSLVSMGELSEGEGRSLLDKLLSQGKLHTSDISLIQKELEAVLIERQVPTRQDLRHLLEQLEKLEAKIDQIEGEN